MTSLWSKTVDRDSEGTLTVGGCTVDALLSQAADVASGMPVFVVDELDFRTRAAKWREALERAFARHGASVSVYYAGKAFLASQVAQWVHEEGLNLDIAYEGELAIAGRANFPGDKLAMHGNSKRRRDIELALDYGVGLFIVDSMSDAELIAVTAEDAGKVARVLVRVTPDVRAGRYAGIETAHRDQKFGVSIATGEATRVLDFCQNSPHLDLRGVHAHLGSQIFELEKYAEAIRRIFAFRRAFATRTGNQLDEVNLGGGFGVPYLDDEREKELEPARVAQFLASSVASTLRELDAPWPTLSFEPGRAIAAQSTMTLYRVGSTKTVELENGSSRRYVAVEGGMSDNMRVVAYGADYTATLASRQSQASLVETRVVGRHCESGDVIVDSVRLPGDLTRGDILAVPVTGAYGHAMSNMYNAVGRPGVLAVRDGLSRWIVNPFTVAELVENLDVAPEESNLVDGAVFEGLRALKSS